MKGIRSPIFTSEMDLKFSFLIMSLPGVDTQVMQVSKWTGKYFLSLYCLKKF